MEYLVIKNTFLDVDIMNVMVTSRSRSCPATCMRRDYVHRMVHTHSTTGPVGMGCSHEKNKFDADTSDSDTVVAGEMNETFSESDSLDAASVHTSDSSGKSTESDITGVSEMNEICSESDSTDAASVHTSDTSGKFTETDITEIASEMSAELDIDVKPPKAYRPCRAKRNRFLKLVKRLEAQVLEDPTGFSMDTVTLPPSLLNNLGERQRLFDLMDSYQHKILASIQP
jgi:hypothetical protein